MISIVVPAFNEEKYIRDCLLSVRNQKYDKNYELIVVDNGSSDSTARIAKEHADKVVYEPKKGVAHARQRGYEAARGNIIAYTDADTIVDEYWLNEIEKSFEDGIVGAYGLIHLSDGTALDKLLAKYGFTAFLKINHACGFPQCVGMNFAVRKAALDAVGGFNTELKSAEDIDLSMRLRKLGKLYLNSRMIVYTSSRRFNLGHLQFFKHHTINYFSMLMLGKTNRGFEDVR